MLSLAKATLYPLTVVMLVSLIWSGNIHADVPASTWARWLTTNAMQHPDVVAAKESMNSAFSLSNSRERPLYNPEFGTEIEREGQQQNYRIGLSQTIDVWDKRSSRQQQANYSRSAAKANYALAVQQKQAELLQTLIQWQGAKQLAALSRSEEKQLETLVELIKKRQKTGDLAQLDAELALLSLSQKLNSLAQAETELMSVEAHLRELSPNWSEARGAIPSVFWVDYKPTQSKLIDQWVDELPEVAAARAQWDVLKQSAKLAKKEAKAEPTIGLNAGKTGEENVVGLTFSIPLNVRNNFSGEVKAANAEALSAEAQYMAVRNKQLAAISSSQSVFQEYQTYYQRWQTIMRGRSKRSDTSLTSLFESGDMSASEYLLALQQRAEGLSAGIELENQYRLAYIDWLVQSGKLSSVLTRLSENKP